MNPNPHVQQSGAMTPPPAPKESKSNIVLIGVISTILFSLAAFAGGYKYHEFALIPEEPEQKPESCVTVFKALSEEGTIPPEGTLLSDECRAIIGYIQESLIQARKEGFDAQIRSTLSSLRARALIYEDDSRGSYTGFCANTGTQESLAAILSDTGVKPSCRDGRNFFIATGKLQSSENYYCVDSTGAAMETTTEPLGQTCAQGIPPGI